MNIRVLFFLSLGISIALISCRKDMPQQESDNIINFQRNENNGSTSQTQEIKRTTTYPLSDIKEEDINQLSLATSKHRKQKRHKDRTSVKAIDQRSGNDEVIKQIQDIEIHRIHSNSNVQYDLTPLIVRNPAINSYIWPYSNFSLSLDNDLFNNTDRYYTNGIHISYSSPAFAFFRINSILPVPVKGSMEFNSIELHHAMYTPYTTKIPPLLKDDRPYASTLFIRFKRKAQLLKSGDTRTASIDIGLIGKAALGSVLQRGVHASIPSNDEPVGWDTQINDDLILNYNYEITKVITDNNNYCGYTILAGALGTLNTNLLTGLGIRTGNLNTVNYSVQKINNQKKRLKKTFLYSAETRIIGNIVGHNASLTGGLLNKNNVFALQSNEIKRVVVSAEARLSFKYGSTGIDIAESFITRELKKGKNHFWGTIGLNFDF